MPAKREAFSAKLAKAEEGTRLRRVPSPYKNKYIIIVILISSLMSLIIGTVVGLTQFRIKRLFAYASSSPDCCFSSYWDEGGFKLPNSGKTLKLLIPNYSRNSR